MLFSHLLENKDFNERLCDSIIKLNTIQAQIILSKISAAGRPFIPMVSVSGLLKIERKSESERRGKSGKKEGKRERKKYSSFVFLTNFFLGKTPAYYATMNNLPEILLDIILKSNNPLSLDFTDPSDGSTALHGIFSINFFFSSFFF